MPAAWICTTQPTQEPVALRELKQQCRVTWQEEDALIYSMGIAARVRCETKIDQQFCTAQWLLTLDHFADWIVEFPRPPFQSLQSATYTDVSGAAQTISSAQYQLDVISRPARIAPAYGLLWPIVRPQLNGVLFAFTAGYGGPQQVPEAIKAAIKIYTAVMYANRDLDTPMPRTVEDLLMSQWHGTHHYKGHTGRPLQWPRMAIFHNAW